MNLRPSSLLVSSFFAATILCSVARSDPAQSEAEGVNVNTLQNDASHPSVVETHYIYTNLKRSANMSCPPAPKSSQTNEEDAIKWQKLTPTSLNMAEECPKPRKDDDDDDDEDKPKCSFIYSNVNSSLFNSTLKIYRLEKEDYGEYSCSWKGKVLRKFVLRGELKATRKVMNRGSFELQRSVFVEVGQNLSLFCNYSEPKSNNEPTNDYTGEPEKDFVSVTWFRYNDSATSKNKSLNWIDITEDIGRNGPFRNFSIEYPHEGIAIHEHRGEYKCEIRPIYKGDKIVDEKTFPVFYTFQIRVQEPNLWITPGVILLIEIILLGIFTFFIWKHEEKKETDDADALPQDSDDDTEEEGSPKLKGIKPLS